jgi:hypothetical protein
LPLPPDLAAIVNDANATFDAEVAAWDASRAAAGDAAALPAAPAAASAEVVHCAVRMLHVITGFGVSRAMQVKEALELARNRETAIISESSSKG